MQELRIGVIGAGGRGQIAQHAHKPEHGVRVIACCDKRAEVLEQCRAQYGADVFVTRDYQELLAQDVDAVFVTTPDFLHEEHAVAALQAGKAVFIEKPLAISIQGCDRILATAMQCQGKVYVGHNMRHMPVIRKMKELIDQGAIGTVKTVWCRHFVGNGGDFYFKDWHAQRRNTNSLLLQKAAHDFDVIHWLAGSYTTKVQAMGALSLYDEVSDRQLPGHTESTIADASHWPPLHQRRLHPVIDVEDLSLVNLQLQNGVLASYQQCHYTPDYWRNYTVIGTEGRIENFGDLGSGTKVSLWNKRHLNYQSQGDHDFFIESSREGHGGADVRTVQEFIRFVREGSAIQTSPVAARESVATGCRATDSIRNGNALMEIPHLDLDVVSYFV